MAKSFKNRIFGGDVPDGVKKKIQQRQKLAGQAVPNAQIDDIYGATNFDGIAELSAKTPAVRMWTSLVISEEEILATLDDKEAEKFRAAKYQKEKGKYINLHKPEYKGIRLRRESDTEFTKYKWNNKADSNKT